MCTKERKIFGCTHFFAIKEVGFGKGKNIYKCKDITILLSIKIDKFRPDLKRDSQMTG